MKTIIIIMTALFISCKPAEFRIKEYSYTKEWYYEEDQRYQVYQTKGGIRYIFVLNKKETKFIRKYLK